MDRVGVGAAAACIKSTFCVHPPTPPWVVNLIVAVRELLDMLGEAMIVTVPLFVPEVGEIETQVSLLLTVQFALDVIDIVLDSPVAVKLNES